AVAGLVLATRSLWELLKVVTAFTVAHTLTLTLSVFNIVRLPSQIVEPMIALSIVVIAAQNIFWPERTRGMGRLLVAFGFGLFHGLGFAGGLLEAMQGIGGTGIAIALVAFSVGVEVGHQCVALPLFGVMRAIRGGGESRPARAAFSAATFRYASTVIALAGLFYMFEALRG
ncbi:MAG: HupE/UreJ family protein, partial [Verrucomicrobiota bacterium]